MFKGLFSERINLAGAFAKNAHMGQTRKYTGEPYIVHPSAVAELLRLNYKECTEEMYMAALLHDTVEDCGVSLNEIDNIFNGNNEEQENNNEEQENNTEENNNDQNISELIAPIINSIRRHDILRQREEEELQMAIMESMQER